MNALEKDHRGKLEIYKDKSCRFYWQYLLIFYFFFFKFNGESLAALRHPRRPAVDNHLNKRSQVPIIFIKLSIIFLFKKMLDIRVYTIGVLKNFSKCEKESNIFPNGNRSVTSYLLGLPLSLIFCMLPGLTLQTYTSWFHCEIVFH